MTSPGLILATDLDGTFLGGPEPARRALYESLAARSDVWLIFVTGRDIEFIRALIAQPGIPRPHFIIGDVGTTVLDGRDFRPIASIQSDIAARWGDATDRVIALLENEPGLELQPTPFRYRVSYYYDPARLSADTVRKVETAGFDCLLSADTYLDVLPRGIGKGPTLLRLLDELALPHDRVLLAGDTLNDLSLFQTGLKGVAVGNSEPALFDAIADFPWVHRSPWPGAAGIADALRHFCMEEETTR
jgi:hydroxymethylpyrimidine pyrophosphatase-like HAD family hydrolase